LVVLGANEQRRKSILAMVQGDKDAERLGDDPHMSTFLYGPNRHKKPKTSTATSDTTSLD
jgi:hypothetical protein